MIIATLAPIINCVQLLPQVYKTYTTKGVDDLSLGSLLLMLLTNALWFLHGYFISDISLIASGSISLLINFILLSLYMRYRRI